MIILPRNEVYNALKEFYRRTPAEKIKKCDDVHTIWAMLAAEEQEALIRIFFKKVADDLPNAILNAIMKNV